MNVELFQDGQCCRWLCILMAFYVFGVNRNGQGPSNRYHGRDKIKVCMAWLRIEPRFKRFNCSHVITCYCCVAICNVVVGTDSLHRQESSAQSC